VKNKEVDADFKTDDIEILSEDTPHEGLKGVNLYTDLPAHNSIQGKGLDQAGSAWLQLGMFMVEEAYAGFVQSKNAMHWQREHVFPMIRRAAAQYKLCNWISIRNQLGDAAEQVDKNLADMHPAYVFSRFADMLFIPILDATTKTACGQEILDCLANARNRDPHAYKQLLNDMVNSQGFPEARVRCVDTCLRLFDAFDAILVALATEGFTTGWRGRLNEFRVFRDDFDNLKAIYVDVFESMNQLLLWIGMLLNLGNRGAVNSWAPSSPKANATFSQAAKWRAVDREFIISEMPQCEALLTKASRDFRNKVGHYGVRLDVVSGDLVFSDNSRQGLLEFHELLLEAGRFQSILLTFCEKITLEHEIEVLGEKLTGWAMKKK